MYISITIAIIIKILKTLLENKKKYFGLLKFEPPTVPPIATLLIGLRATYKSIGCVFENIFLIFCFMIK